jgi:S1-C subfamily serine protease
MNADLKAGIVRVIGPDGETAGTCFLVTDDGLIATCAHVVENAGARPGDTVRVAFHATGEEREAQVEPAWWRGPDAEDVAVLRLDGPLPERAMSLSLGSSAGVGGHVLSTFGFPDAKPVEGMAGKCEVVGGTTEGGFPVLQLRSSEVTPGFSGAPVWDEDLHVVVGMVTSIAAQDQYTANVKLCD